MPSNTTSQEFMQIEEEIDALRDNLVAEGVRSFLEVGSKFGGSLSRIANALPKGSRIVSVDLPKGTRLWHLSEPALRGTVAGLNADGYDAHIVWGDSTSQAVIDQVKALGPFDACFIDANHALSYLEQDWRNYGSISRLVAFHDIAWHRQPEWVGTRIDAKDFWEKLKVGYRHAEFKFCATGKNNGIGLLWREEKRS